MFLTPVRELTISTASKQCEIVSDNICHYNVGQNLNFANNKNLYISVKDVKVPSVKKEISFYFCYKRKEISKTSLYEQCTIAYYSFQDLALNLARTANNKIEDRRTVNPEGFLKIKYKNERFYIDVPIGFKFGLSADICRLFGLQEELYSVCDLETKLLVNQGELTKDEALKTITTNVVFNNTFTSSSVTVNFYSPSNSYCLFNFFDIIQSPRVVEGTNYSILFSYDLALKKCVEPSHPFFDIKPLKKDQLCNLRFSFLNKLMQPYSFNIDLKANPITFVLVIFSA